MGLFLRSQVATSFGKQGDSVDEAWDILAQYLTERAFTK
jgi:hypothetical protein